MRNGMVCPTTPSQFAYVLGDHQKYHLLFAIGNLYLFKSLAIHRVVRQAAQRTCGACRIPLFILALSSTIIKNAKLALPSQLQNESITSDFLLELDLEFSESIALHLLLSYSSFFTL